MFPFIMTTIKAPGRWTFATTPTSRFTHRGILIRTDSPDQRNGTRSETQWSSDSGCLLQLSAVSILHVRLHCQELAENSGVLDRVGHQAASRSREKKQFEENERRRDDQLPAWRNWNHLRWLTPTPMSRARISETDEDPRRSSGSGSRDSRDTAVTMAS